MKALESQLSKIAGTKVEITLRGDDKFTYCFDGENAAAEQKIKDYFKETGSFHEDSGYDDDCDMTCLFHNL